MNGSDQTMRLDKWLWVARFFKTRSAASAAITGGKVHVNGERVKPARLVRPGDTLKVTRGQQFITLTINGLAKQRRPAREAQKLYVETPESRKRREFEAEQRRFLNAMTPSMARRPNKRERRRIRRIAGKQ